MGHILCHVGVIFYLVDNLIYILWRACILFMSCGEHILWRTSSTGVLHRTCIKFNPVGVSCGEFEFYRCHVQIMSKNM